MKKIPLLLSVIAVLFFAVKASAFSVSPIAYRSTIEPGASQAFGIKVINDEKNIKKFNVSVNSVRSMPDGKRFYESGFNEAEKWVSISDESFELAPGSSKNINAIINIPVGAAAGSYELAFMIASESLDKSELGLVAKSAVPVNLIVSGVVTERINIKKFIVNKINFDKTWLLNLELYNEGTVSVEGAGWLEISNIFNKKIAARPVGIGNHIFPQTLRQISQEIDASKFLPGVYKLKIIVEYGAAHAAVASETTVTYLPINFLVSFVILSFVLILVLWKLKKSRQ